jgi:hypothetical protein
MALYYVTYADVGAPVLSGTNGAGTAVFNWILNTTAGLTIAYSGTNRSVVTMPDGSVLRYYHDSAASGDARFMICRAAESASAVDTLAKPFPLTSQVADSVCNVLCSTTANSTARAWWAFVDTDPQNCCFYFFTNPGSAQAAGSFLWGGGTIVSALPVDSYSTFCFSRNSAVASDIAAAPGNIMTTGLSSAAPNKLFLMRSRDGVVESSQAAFGPYLGSTQLQTAVAGPAYPDPDDAKLRMCKLTLMDYYSQSTSAGAAPEPVRMWAPRLFMPMHQQNTWGSVALGDTFAASSYDAAAQFAFFKFGTNIGAQGALAVQIAGPWAVPSG